MKDLIANLKSQIELNRNANEDPDSSSWNYEEGVLISTKAAQAVVDAIENVWQPIETAPENKVVLTQHVDDLYPVAAFKLDGVWFREIEGPEDMYRRGKNDELYRTPTNWMPLPEPPTKRR